jgi:hypothetical protein
MYAPKLAVDKTPTAKAIAKAARLSSGEVLFPMGNPYVGWVDEAVGDSKKFNDRFSTTGKVMSER